VIGVSRFAWSLRAIDGDGVELTAFLKVMFRLAQYQQEMQLYRILVSIH
jgi:hypothetical protein